MCYSVKKILASMNSYTPPKEPSPAQTNLKRSPPVTAKKKLASSPFPDAKKMEQISPAKPDIVLPASEAQPLPTTQTSNNSTQTPTTQTPTHIQPILEPLRTSRYLPTRDLWSSEDELTSSEMKPNKKRSSLSRQLSASADNMINLGEDEPQSFSRGLLRWSKRKASRSKSSENISVIGLRSSSRRKLRRSSGTSTETKTPPTSDGKKLKSLAQGLFTNLKIPKFGRQQSESSEPAVRLSWYVKIYDGSNELESYPRDFTAAEAEASAKKLDNGVTKLVEDNGSNKRRYRHSKYHMVIVLLISCLPLESAESSSPHFFKQMNFARIVNCFVCRKPFSGFLSNGLKCQGIFEICTCIYPITDVSLNHYIILVACCTVSC